MQRFTTRDSVGSALTFPRSVLNTILLEGVVALARLVSSLASLTSPYLQPCSNVRCMKRFHRSGTGSHPSSMAYQYLAGRGTRSTLAIVRSGTKTFVAPAIEWHDGTFPSVTLFKYFPMESFFIATLPSMPSARSPPRLLAAGSQPFTRHGLADDPAFDRLACAPPTPLPLLGRTESCSSPFVRFP